MSAPVIPSSTPLWPAALAPEFDTTLVGRDRVVAVLEHPAIGGQVEDLARALGVEHDAEQECIPGARLAAAPEVGGIHIGALVEQ